jgi:N6-adenosine-specific RNA methylase IME4
MTPFAGLPRNHFAAILADPPWPFKTWSPKGQGRSGEAHYATLSHADLEAPPVGELAADDAVLFMWIVQTQIPQAVRLFEAWGFELKSVAFGWLKGDGQQLFPDDPPMQIGMGKWTRAEFEQCWLGTRGNPKRLNADVRQVLVEKRREHSRKPDGIHDRIERLVAGPYLELFARKSRPGWILIRACNHYTRAASHLDPSQSSLRYLVLSTTR